MLSPFSSSAEKNAARQSCSDTVGPQSHDIRQVHSHASQPELAAAKSCEHCPANNSKIKTC